MGEFFGKKVERHRRLILILRNRSAGTRSGANLLNELNIALSSNGYEVRMIDCPDELARLVREQLSDVRVVIAAGGDGTMSLVANRTPANVPLTVFPLGTENLLAKNFAISTDIAAMLALIQKGHVDYFDAGSANGKMFIVMLSCGFDAEVVARVHAARRGHVSRWSYFKQIAFSLRDYPHPPLSISAQRNGTAVTVSPCHWMFVFNLPKYAAGLRIASDANARDGLLDLQSFRGGSSWQGLFHFATVLLGSHGRWSGSEHHLATSILICSSGDVPYQLDGDPGGRLPVEVEVLPRRLCLMLPTARRTL